MDWMEGLMQVVSKIMVEYEYGEGERRDDCLVCLLAWSVVARARVQQQGWA